MKTEIYDYSGIAPTKRPLLKELDYLIPHLPNGANIDIDGAAYTVKSYILGIYGSDCIVHIRVE